MACMAELQREVGAGGFSTLDKVMASALVLVILNSRLPPRDTATPDFTLAWDVLKSFKHRQPHICSWQLVVGPGTSPLSWIYLLDTLRSKLALLPSREKRS